MIQVLLALLASVGAALGNKTGALIVQLAGTIGLITMDTLALENFAKPWITWANGIVDANRTPTAEENAAANALADAVHANNQSLGAGGAGVPLPSPPVG